MREQMELPVNKEGFMRSNAKQAALYAIMTSNEYAGELNGVISRFRIESNYGSFDYFSEAEKFIRQLKEVKVELDNRNKELRFYSHPYTENKYAYLYQDMEETVSGCSIEVKVDYIQNSDAWSQIKIILSNGIWAYNKKTGEAYFENECSLKLTSQGRLFFHSSKIQRDIRICDYEMNQSILLKLEIRSHVVAIYSFDGIHWEILCEEEIDYLKCGEIGLFVQPKINTFFYDFYTGNTQLFFNTEKRQIMTFPQLEHDDRYFSNRVEEYSIPCELITYSGMELIDFFIKLIEDYCYIYLKLQNYYVFESKNFNNETIMYMSILYGFDKKKRVFKRMAFDQGLEFSEISFEKFLTQYYCVNDSTEIITLYRYKSWRYPNNFNGDMMLSNLKAYVEGKSSFAVTSRKKILYFTEKPFVYGVKIYEEIAENDVYMDCFLTDVRLSNQISEHYSIMLKMLDFMKHIAVISDEKYKNHVIGFRNLARLSGRIGNLVLRNEMNQIENIREKLAVLLRELKQEDEIETKKLIRSLSEKAKH